MRKLLPLIGVPALFFLFHGAAWTQTTYQTTALGVGQAAPFVGDRVLTFRVGLYDERLCIRPDERVRHRLWLVLSTWIVADVRSNLPVTLVGEHHLTPPGQWTMERTTRFSIGETPWLPSEQLRPGINTFYKEFRLAFLDFPPASLSESSNASLATLFDPNQTVNVKLSFRAPNCPGCPSVPDSEAKEYDLKPFAYALLSAAGSGNVNIVKELLDKGTDPDSATAHRWTALMEAASKGRSRVVRVLLDHGARVNIIRRGFPFVLSPLGSVIPSGETAVMAASSAGNPEIIRNMLRQTGIIISSTPHISPI